MELYPYSGDGKQFKTYISQIMRVFSGFQVEANSNGELKRIPIVYGGMNRIVASILSKDQDGFANNRVPLMAVNLVGIDPDSMGKRSPRHEDQVSNLMANGADRTFASRIIGPSFIMNFELSIYAAESAAGANATEIKTSGVLAGDALGDWAAQECTAEEINAPSA